MAQLEAEQEELYFDPLDTGWSCVRFARYLEEDICEHTRPVCLGQKPFPEAGWFLWLRCHGRQAEPPHLEWVEVGGARPSLGYRCSSQGGVHCPRQEVWPCSAEAASGWMCGVLFEEVLCVLSVTTCRVFLNCIQLLFKSFGKLKWLRLEH